MAEIHLCAIDSICGGPDIPAELGAFIREHEWPGGGTSPKLHLSFGRDTVIVWPADPRRIREWAEKLAKIADSMEGR